MRGKTYRVQLTAGVHPARQVKSIVTEHYPQADKVVLVMDNLNTHTLSSLYETFPAEEAFAIAQKLELQYTSRQGSWLNIAEIELSGMTSQCLNRRIDTLEKLSDELGAWQLDRNTNRKIVTWQFTTEDARMAIIGRIYGPLFGQRNCNGKTGFKTPVPNGLSRCNRY
jgi:hypothetical protein